MDENQEEKPPEPIRRPSELDRYRKDLENMSKAELIRRVQDAERMVKETEVEVERMAKEREQIVALWQDASANLAEVKATVGYTLDDRHFIDSWLELSYDIKGWAMEHFSGSISSFSMKAWFQKQNPSQVLIDLTFFWREYLKSNEHRPVLVQALIWALLEKHVFAMQKSTQNKPPHGAYWAFQDQQTVAKLNEALRPRKSDIITAYVVLTFKAIKNIREIKSFHPNFERTVKQYFEWRVNTVVSIERKWASATTTNRPNPNAQRLAEKIEKILQPFPRSSNGDFRGGLEKIILSAIRLDADMWRQKSFIHPSKPKYFLINTDAHAHYNPESMDVWEGILPNEDEEPNPEITLFIAPSLMKSGDANGDGYDVFQTLVKGKVSCDQTFAKSRYYHHASHTNAPGHFSPTPGGSHGASRMSLDAATAASQQAAKRLSKAPPAPPPHGQFYQPSVPSTALVSVRRHGSQRRGGQ